MIKKIIATQIDLARQKETTKRIFSFLDTAKRFNYNTVFLYMEDRIKTASYPYIPDEEAYSPDEINEITEYGERLGLELIPVVNNLSHAERFLEHNELRHLAELRDNIRGRFNEAGEAPLLSTCPSLKETYTFFDRYFEEVISLFPSKYFCAGLDEYFDIGTCELCRKRAEKDGGFGRIFLEHVVHTNNLVNSLGKTLIMADDMFCFCNEILPEIPKNIIMFSWCYEFVDRAPAAQFADNRRVDLFKLYDRLGLKYICAVWANFDFNTDSYTDYAKRYNPLGFMATTWQMESFEMLYMHPLVAYAGLLWGGTYETKPFERMKLAVKGTMGADDSNAATVAFAAFTAFLSRPPRMYYFCNDILVRKNVNFDDWHKTNLYLYEMLTPIKEKNDCIKQLWFRAERSVLMYETFLLAQRLFDYRTGVRNDDLKEIKKELTEISEALKKEFSLQREKWQEYRPGIRDDRLADEEETMLGDIDELISKCDCCSFGESGAIDVTFFMPDKSTRVLTELCVRHGAETEFKRIGKDLFKPLCTSNYNISEKGPFTFVVSFIADDIENIAEYKLSFSGYGKTYISYICARHGKTVFVPSQITDSFGKCTQTHSILVNDTTFAAFGYDDMTTVFKDLSKSRDEHGLRLKMGLEYEE